MVSIEYIRVQERGKETHLSVAFSSLGAIAPPVSRSLVISSPASFDSVVPSNTGLTGFSGSAGRPTGSATSTGLAGAFMSLGGRLSLKRSAGVLNTAVSAGPRPKDVKNDTPRNSATAIMMMTERCRAIVSDFGFIAQESLRLGSEEQEGRTKRYELSQNRCGGKTAIQKPRSERLEKKYQVKRKSGKKVKLSAWQRAERKGISGATRGKCLR